MEEDTVFRVADLDALQRNAAFHYRAAETKRRIRRHRALTVADPEVVSMFLITGATGNVGGEIVRHLLERNQKVRALVRGDASQVLHTDVEIATGDLNKPESLSPALKNVHGVFLLGGYPDMPGLLRGIRDAGVERVVLLTSRSAETGDRTNAIVNMWMDSEEAVFAAGVPWTILHPAGFMSNALRWLPQMRSGSQTIRVAFADVPVAVIDPYDIAAVAAAELTSDGHECRTLPVTGPEAITPLDQVRILATVLGRDLRGESQPDEEAREEISRSMSPATAEAFYRFYAKGEFDDSAVSPTVQEITGRAPRSFEQWARTHAAKFQ
jgi:uncharacterized protein YbjT (DUF2867 family)